MAYWFEDPFLKGVVLPLAVGSAIRGLTTPFGTPMIIMGYNALPEGMVIGPSALDFIGNRCPKKRAFIVTDDFSKKFAPKVIRSIQMGGFTAETWSGALPEVPLDTVEECAKAMAEFEPDLIIAIGGGSVMDTAKVSWVRYERPDITDLNMLPVLELLGLRKKALLVAVPTTSGTGSECTAFAVVHDVEADRKVPLVNPDLVPDFAILDPEFTMDMPPRLTAGTGLDALAHAVDAVSVPTANELTDAISLESIRMVFRYLPRAYKNGRDREARQKMLMAATMAGIGFGNSSTALTHSFGHSLGGLFHVHHGIAVGIFIPYALQFYSQVTDKYLAICRALDINGGSREEGLASLVEKVRALMKELDIPLSIKDLGISRDEFDKNLEKLVQYAYEDIDTFVSPRPITLDQYETIFRYAYEGRDVDF